MHNFGNGTYIQGFNFLLRIFGDVIILLYICKKKIEYGSGNSKKINYVPSQSGFNRSSEGDG